MRLSLNTAALRSRFLQDGLHRSSTLLIAAQGINAVAAFLFWLLCARLFPASQVGLATAFISFGLLVATFTHLGLPTTVLRFLPTSKHRGGLFSAAVLLVTLASATGGLLALLAIGHLAPRLGFVQHSLALSLMLVAVVVGSALGGLLDGVLASLRASKYVLGKAVLTNVPRIVLPFAVATLGMQGMAGVYSGMLLLGVLYSLVVIVRRFIGRGNLQPRFIELRRHRNFAAANYFGSMFGILPGTLTPLIVLQILGPAQAAFFYMPMQLAVFLGIIASSTCQALLAEVAQTEDADAHRRQVVGAAKHLYQLLLPAAIGLCVFGWGILRVYGAAYAAHGLQPLFILCAASLFVAMNWIGDTWLNIQKKPLAYFLMNAFNAAAVVGSVYILAGHGLVGVALGWLLGQVVSAGVYVVLFARDQLAAVVLPARVLRKTAYVLRAIFSHAKESA
ncbi:MAG TPA: oligosaccharide flippase family protein [Candidatus Saccharimonadales bacterium]|nr:oligosaccharide flippase family protein [Candidatus Saccharimonadales bacterium]